jgi:hypothetical protein
MNVQEQKQSIRDAAVTYAKSIPMPVDATHASAVLFDKVADSFHPTVWETITRNPQWHMRTEKLHQNVPGAKEMQSSNSSDALLMNIFCHPRVATWKGVQELLGSDLSEITFGYLAGVSIAGGCKDATEIDLAVPGVFCEAKLTETDFTRKRAEVVESYDGLQAAFHVDRLPRAGEEYDNYQVIRNLLASMQHGRAHVLLCDERRDDLVARYTTTVACLRDVSLRQKCRVVYWQQIIAACDDELRAWLSARYGMSAPGGC